MLKQYRSNIVDLLCFVVGVLLLIFVLPKCIMFFLPILIGWIIAAIANPIVHVLEKLKIVRKHGSAVAIILVIGLVVLIGYGIVSWIISFASGFADYLPELYDSIVEGLGTISANLSGFAQKLPADISNTISAIMENFTEYLGRIVGVLASPTAEAVGDLIKQIPNAFVLLIFTLLSSYFLTARHDSIQGFVRKVVPQSIYERWTQILSKFKAAVKGYFVAQVKIMGIVAAILLIGFLILKVRYAVLFAILIAILDMLPLFGTGTALCPWAVYRALQGDYKMAIALVVIYIITLVVHQMAQPKLVGDSVGLDPFQTLLFMFVGYKFAGLLGMIIAIPVGMILIQFYQAGAFDNVITDVKVLGRGILDMRKKDES